LASELSLARAAGKATAKTPPGSGLIIVAFFVIWLALPLWFPWLLRPLAAAEGLTMLLTRAKGIRVSNSRSHADQSHREILRDTLSGLVPSSWLWRLASGGNSGPEPFIAISGWQFVLIPSGAPSFRFMPMLGMLVPLRALEEMAAGRRLTNGSYAWTKRPSVCRLSAGRAARSPERFYCPNQEASSRLALMFLESRLSARGSSPSLHLSSQVSLLPARWAGNTKHQLLVEQPNRGPCTVRTTDRVPQLASVKARDSCSGRGRPPCPL